MNKRSIPGLKDASGAYLPTFPIKPQDAPGSIESAPSRGSLDDILKQQLTGLERLTKHLVAEITAGNITKETPNQLAVCLKITLELKEKEKELLDGMTDEELEAASLG